MNGKSHSNRPRRNLPGPGALSLDHLGWFVPDAEAARQALLALGFTVTPFSAQVSPDPVKGDMRLTGTGNVCVMLEAGYLEFLAHTADTPIGLEFKAALARRAGIHLTAFGVADALALHGTLEARGIAMRPVARFSRTVPTEDGTAEARFTVARLAEGAMPEGRVQFVTHHAPSATWQPRWLTHPNGALALESMLVAAPNPTATAHRLASLLNRAVERSGETLTVRLEEGALEVLSEADGERLVGSAVAPRTSAVIGARLRIADEERMARFASNVRTAGGDLVVRLPDALGRSVLVCRAD